MSVVEQAGGRMNAAVRGAQCWLEPISSLVILGLLGLVPWPRRSAPPHPRTGRAGHGWLSFVFLGCCLLGVAMTLRFYSHDNVQLWPGLAVMAVDQKGSSAEP